MQPEVVADHQVARAPESDAERQPGSAQVGELPEVEAVTAEVQRRQRHTPQEPTDQRDPALPDLEPLHRGAECIQVTDDIGGAGSDDRPDDAPGGRVPGVVLVEALRTGPPCHEPRPYEAAESNAHPVRGELQRPDADAGDDLPADHWCVLILWPRTALPAPPPPRPQRSGDEYNARGEVRPRLGGSRDDLCDLRAVHRGEGLCLR